MVLTSQLCRGLIPAGFLKVKTLEEIFKKCRLPGSRKRSHSQEGAKGGAGFAEENLARLTLFFAPGVSWPALES